ncbi:MAG TPA: hypothetical protein PLZ55_07370 [bacterium]|nr:hypothetical protein [bacterium]
MDMIDIDRECGSTREPDGARGEQWKGRENGSGGRVGGIIGTGRDRGSWKAGDRRGVPSIAALLGGDRETRSARSIVDGIGPGGHDRHRPGIGGRQRLSVKGYGRKGAILAGGRPL